MKIIQVNNILPNFISDVAETTSEIWSKDVCFSKGERYLLRAVSGKGKSSLFSYIFGERTDYKGDVLFDQMKVSSLSSFQWTEIRQTQISFVFQGLRLFPNLTVMENLILKNHLTGYKTLDEIRILLKKVGLEKKTEEKVARLSYGQQQRVAIIRALCQPFDFILMDEPFSHLDNDNIAILAEIINTELKQRNAGLLLSSLGEEYPFDYDQQFML